MSKTRRISGRLGRFSRSLAAGAGLAATRFPLAAVLVVCVSVLSNLTVAEVELLSETTFARLVAALIGGAAGSVAVRLAAETRTTDPRVRTVAPPAAALAIAAAIWFGEPFALHAAALVSAALLVIPLAPFTFRGSPGRFWIFTLWTAVGLMLAFVSVLLFVLGLSAILEMIRFLFHVGPDTDAYGHIFTTAFTLVGPLFALGRIPGTGEAETRFVRDERMVNDVRPLFDWVGAPLTIVAAGVLHLYAARIAVTGEVPEGEIGWIVTVFALLVLSLRIAIDPFITDGAATSRVFGRLWAPMLVVPLGLLFYAAWLRIGAEGVTLERYFLVLGAIAAALIVALQLVPKARGDIRVIAGIPILLIALSVAGPWGAAGVVGRSQADRIAAELARNPAGELAGGLDALGEDVKSRLRSRVYALGEVEQLWRVVPLVAEPRREAVAALLRSEPDAGGLIDALALTASNDADSARSFVGETGRILDTDGFDRAVFARWVSGAFEAPEEKSLQVRFDADDLVIVRNGVEDRFPLRAAIRALPESLYQSGAILPDPPVVDLSSAAGRRARVRIESLTTSAAGGAPDTGTLTLLFRAADWPAAPLLGGGGEGR